MKKSSLFIVGALAAAAIFYAGAASQKSSRIPQELRDAPNSGAASMEQLGSAQAEVNTERPAAKKELPVPARPEAQEKTLSNFKYQCSSVDENTPYEIKRITLQIEGPGKPALLSFKARKPVNEKYIIDPAYAPKPGSAMEGFLKLNVSEPDYQAYGEGPLTPFYAEEKLMTGGYELKIGKMGGFIKTAGAGYSWANYICVR